ncbi:hypothetical protein GN958_ATG11554 [Phytophthora infestans]|uniref:Bzip transcription factor n=1 Tax=Phytophthora infestans TaxID=4787 RepID=A0A8S9UJQ0_PHYIN|nr:hypothetical protein GN958_ATG11554 [Phytophthora infestans]
MNSYALLPPNSSALSDAVIGAVMQRSTWNARDRTSNRIGNSANVAHSCQQKPRRQTQRHELYKKLFKGSHESPAKVSVATSKKTVLSSSSIIEKIQGADHHITPELQQAIVTEALKKKIRHRERCRINQARYRQRQMQVETGIEDQINKLKAEIKGLERKSTDTMSSPGTLYKMASKFLHGTMAASVIDGATYGPEAQLDNWRFFAYYFDDVRVELKGLKTPTSDTLVAAMVSVGLKVGCGAKMVNKKIVMQGSVMFGWDSASDKVTSIYAQADLVTPLLNLLGSLEDVSCAFYKARVTPDCRFVRGS